MGKKRRGYQLTNLRYKPWETKWILPHDNPTSIADHFCDAAQENRRREKPCPPSEALDQVDDQSDAEERDENGVGDARGSVFED